MVVFFSHWVIQFLKFGFVILAHNPSGLLQGSRALAYSNTGSPRFTDFPSNLANLIGWEYEMNTLRMLRKSGLARALDPYFRPEESLSLGTRMTTCILNPRPFAFLTVREGSGEPGRISTLGKLCASVAKIWLFKRFAICWHHSLGVDFSCFFEFLQVMEIKVCCLLETVSFSL